jgi:type II secretory pathway component GspD/PulD (secretin)
MEVEMVSPNVIRQSLKTLTPALFFLLCCSIGAFAQTPAQPQESGRKDLIKVAFGNMSVKTAIATVVKQMGIEVLFDDTVKEDRITIELNDVTVKQALKIILLSKNLQARVMEEKTIIVFPDNEANRQKYEQYELWPAKSDANK